MDPQFFPWATHVVGVHPHTFGVPPPPHVWGEVHAPQLAVLVTPQLSAAFTEPQFLPSLAQKADADSGVHTSHTFGVTPPQMPVTQIPQLAVRGDPQLSVAVTVPQFLPSRAQKAASDSAVHPHRFAIPPPPQLAGRVQVPHIAVRGDPQLSVPVKRPQVLA